MRDKKLEDILKERFAEATSQPSEALKEKILHRQKSEKKKKLYSILAVAASLSIIVISVIILLKQPDNKQPMQAGDDVTNKEDTLILQPKQAPLAQQDPVGAEKPKADQPDKATDNWEVVSANNAVKTIKLPDGSTVHLNRNSELKFPKEFARREVILKGEAFFDVVKSNKSFTVESDRLKVAVLGTSFDVVDNNNGKAAVYTVSGTVRVENQKSSVILQANEFCVLSPEGLEKGEGFDKNNLAWKTGVLAFEQAPVKEVLNSLQKHYGVTFEIDAGKDCLVTSTLANKDLEQTIEMLQVITGLNFEKTSNGYKVSGNCKS